MNFNIQCAKRYKFRLLIASAEKFWPEQKEEENTFFLTLFFFFFFLLPFEGVKLLNGKAYQLDTIYYHDLCNPFNNIQRSTKSYFTVKYRKSKDGNLFDFFVHIHNGMERPTE